MIHIDSFGHKSYEIEHGVFLSEQLFMTKTLTIFGLSADRLIVS
jgi:hypothetical protein